MPLQEASERLAEDFHNRVAPQTYGMIVATHTALTSLSLSPGAIHERGWVCRLLRHRKTGRSYSAVAMFNSEDIKGMFARFDPESVPEGRRYETTLCTVGVCRVCPRRLMWMGRLWSLDTTSQRLTWREGTRIRQE